MRNDDLVIVSVGLPPDFVVQPSLLSFEEPDHAIWLIGATRRVCSGQAPERRRMTGARITKT
jgi:hypothetical protein